MIDTELLQLLRCPVTKQKLTLASTTELFSINQAITEGRLKNVEGKTVAKKIGGALIREDRQVIYLMRNNIPIMLKGECVEIKGLLG